MKWKPIASVVIDRLCASRLVDTSQAAELRSLVFNGEAATAFRRLQKLMTEAGWSVGWNKILRGRSLYGWYGSTIAILPLRFVALEIETNVELWESCSQLLMALYNHRGQPSSEGLHPETSRLIQALGVNMKSKNLDRLGVELLRRLNLDHRELPLIERIHWSGDACTTILSDGGRLQVTRGLVWARAIESGIGTDGRIDPQLRVLLTGVNAEQTEIALPKEKVEEGTAACLNCLRMYRMAKVEVERICFSIPVGEFPALALEIWECASVVT